MLTVHLIGNAHLDPVWMWRRSEGIDATIATARSACDRLDEYPQFVFTCSSSWFHEVVQRHDAGLFERIRVFIAAGRWQPVGGMVIEPDCNFPSADGLARQLAHGQRYFRGALGRAATVGYNVDSFGHSAYLPRLLREAGIDSYVFGRPGPHEKPLPASLFRWRSPDGAEVLAFRVIGGYNHAAADLREHVELALAGTPGRIEHTMCFFGVGDHGGGPTAEQIEWIGAHADGFDGARLVFSHPRAFFDAVAGQAQALPVVTGELQHHAIGCYSVERRIKVAVRRAEAALVQAEQVAGRLADHAPPELLHTLQEAWEAVLLNHFHDVLGGTSIDLASRSAAGQIAAAQSAAEGAITLLTRRAAREQAEPGTHKVIVFNPSDEPFDGAIEHEPWLAGRPMPDAALADEAGRPLPQQPIESRGQAGWLGGVLFRLGLEPGQMRTLRLLGPDEAAPPPASGALAAEPTRLANRHLRVEWGRDEIRFADWTARLEVHQDSSDTWSHSCGDRFEGPRLGSFTWQGPWEPIEQGPLRAAVRGHATFDHSRLWGRLMLLDGEPALRLRLSVVWSQARQMLRLRLSSGQEIRRRMDLVAGGPLERDVDGREYPVNGALVVATDSGGLAVVAPEIFSVSVDRQGLSLTLLRSPHTAHHDPAPAEARPDQPVTDQGHHRFDLMLHPGAAFDLAGPARAAGHMLAGPVVWDLTG